MKSNYFASSALLCLAMGIAHAEPLVTLPGKLNGNQSRASALTPDYSATWLKQISISSATLANIKSGQGITIAIVDTGITPTHAELNGRVSSLSSCAAVSFRCSNGVIDDQGHGTAVAAIAAGAYNGSSAIMSGVAPGVTIVAEKVLSAAGSGYDVDVASGLRKAADAGASVINLSLTYAPTPNIVNAMNYAAGKGAVIVFAGGNENTSLAGGGASNGLTTATLSRLIFAGSVNSGNAKSSFSNMPGNGVANAPGKSATYSSLWISAPGEQIVAPSVKYGMGAYGYWSGTSMAAPVVTGAVALLQKTWPVLTRNGTAAAVLFATASDLGTSGVDATYGNGLLNLTRAFAPVGSLSAVGPTGQSVPLGASTSAIVSSATLGTLKGLGTALKGYSVFDVFTRNFSADLGSLITKPAGTTVSLSSLVFTPVWTNTLKLAGGAQLDLVRDALADGSDRPFDRAAYGAAGLVPHRPSNYVAYSAPSGLMLAGGYGISSGGFYTRALWGAGGATQGLAARLESGQALSSLAQGGYSASAGLTLADGVRVAANWTGTPETVPTLSRIQPRTAQAGSVGVMVKPLSALAVSLTFTALNEKAGLLGSSYSEDSALNLGFSGASYATDITSVLDFGEGRALSLNVSEARSAARSVNSGLIARVGELTSRGYGLAFSVDDVVRSGDRLIVSIRQPLQLRQGNVDLAQTDVDAEGYNHTSVVRTRLTGGPAQTDFGLGYNGQIGCRTSLQTDVAYRLHPSLSARPSDLMLRATIQTQF